MDSGFEHRVCDDGDLVRLAECLEALHDLFQNRIVTCGGECGLKRHTSQCPPSSCDCAPPSHRSIVLWRGREADHPSIAMQTRP